jgi:GAF domain-containing protein
MTTNATAHAPTEDAAAASSGRELAAVHEIAQAFLAATHPVEVYRLALARLTPVVRADFGAVFVRDEADPDLLKPICVQGWPQATALYLGQLRIRVGLGPTGRAVAENAAVEVEDIFADPELREWQEPARELGFASLITLPLVTSRGVNGALSFYFAAARRFTDEERRLLRLIAEQLAATTTRARLFDDIRTDVERLRRETERLQAALRQAQDEARAHDQLLIAVSGDLRNTLDTLGATVRADARSGNGAELLAHAALHTVRDMSELLELRLGRLRVQYAPEDGVRLARQALEQAGPPPAGVVFLLDAGEAIVPMSTDGPRVVRVLATLLALAFRRTARGEIVLSVAPAQDEAGSWVDWRVAVRGMGVDAGGATVMVTNGHNRNLEIALARALAAALGGEMSLNTEPGTGSMFCLRLPARPARAS